MGLNNTLSFTPWKPPIPHKAWRNQSTARKLCSLPNTENQSKGNQSSDKKDERGTPLGHFVVSSNCHPIDNSVSFRTRPKSHGDVSPIRTLTHLRPCQPTVDQRLRYNIRINYSYKIECFYLTMI